MYLKNNYNKFPEELKNSAHFCVWSNRRRNNRLTKVPYNPKTGAGAKSNDSSTFGSFTKAVQALEKRSDIYAGIGIGLFDNLIGIDIDHCISEDGELSDLAARILERVQSYAEKSPSKSGIHILCYATLPISDKEEYKRKYLLKNTELGLEIYPADFSHRFLTVTGDALNEESVNDCTDAVKAILEEYMLRKQTNASSPTHNIDNDSDLGNCGFGLSDEEVKEKMFSSRAGEKIKSLWDGNYDTEVYSSQSEADLAFCSYLAFWCRKDADQMDRLFRQSGLYREKWDEMRGDKTYGAKTIDFAIENTTAVWSPGYCPIDTGEGIEAALSFLREKDMIHNGRYKLNDIGLSNLLADYLRPFARPIPGEKENASAKWIYYDGIHWTSSNGVAVVHEATKDLCQAMQRYATELNETDMLHIQDVARKYSQAGKRKQLIQDASSVYPVSRSAFDKNEWFFNCNNGTIDLKSGILHEHDPDNLITHVSSVDFIEGAKCNRWETFIHEITEPSEEECNGQDKNTVWKEKEEFLQKCLGYCLCGDISEESLLILFGASTRNGKSVCTESVKNVLGTYAITINSDMLMLAKYGNNSHREEVAALAGKRMACAAEIAKGALLDASSVKDMTGGTKIRARFLYENSFEYLPQYKILMSTNHLPLVNDLSVFESGRINVLPFSQHFKPDDQDKGLKQFFREPQNQSGILNWLIEGLHKYLKEERLKPPPVVQNATDNYRQDSDKTGRYIKECLQSDIDGKITTVALYRDYKQWCGDNGLQSESSRKFLKNIAIAGIPVVQDRPCPGANSTSVIKGYSLVPDVA